MWLGAEGVFRGFCGFFGSRGHDQKLQKLQAFWVSAGPGGSLVQVAVRSFGAGFWPIGAATTTAAATRRPKILRFLVCAAATRRPKFFAVFGMCRRHAAAENFEV